LIFVGLLQPTFEIRALSFGHTLPFTGGGVYCPIYI
jgi:hypothetical protein